MGIFKKKNITPQDVDRYCQKRNEGKLIKLLRHENPSIVEKAERALCALAVDEDAKKERSEWAELFFDNALKKLESPKLSEHRKAIDPYIQALRREKQEIFKIRHLLKEAGFDNIPLPDLNEIKGVLEPDENIEYAVCFGVGSGWCSEQGLFLTNKRIICYYRGYSFNRFTPIRYDSITKIERRNYKTKIIYDTGDMKVLTVDELISRIARHVPKLKNTL